MQESGSSFSLEMEKVWLNTREAQLKETLQVLTSGPDRLLKAIQTRNHSDFMYEWGQCGLCVCVRACA